jgi:nitrate/TMAO reductase-like tetraheme cytochrome c subunit
MDPYYASWASSKHKDVRCVECHFEPGLGNEFRKKFDALTQLAGAITGNYSPRPFAQVSDASCLRSGCHDAATLPATTRFSRMHVGFRHATHLGDLGGGLTLACTSCHSQATTDSHMTVRVETCVLCHVKHAGPVAGRERLAQCDTCHVEPPVLTASAAASRTARIDHAEVKKQGMRCVQCHADVFAGAGDIGRERCMSCHNDAEKLRRIDEPAAMHVVHVTKQKIDCYRCHAFIEHKLDVSKVKGHKDDCASCHQQTHSPQAALYLGQGAKGVTAEADPMSKAGVDCSGCHLGGAEPGAAVGVSDGGHRGVTRRAGPASCASCHAERYQKFMPEFVVAADKMLADLDARAGAVTARLKEIEQAKGRIEVDQYRVARDARFNVDFVRAAAPIHNPIFAVDTLRHVHRSLSAIEESLALKVPGERPTGLEPEDCGVCHDHMAMPGRLALDAGRSYPHDTHVEKTGLGCNDCHKGDKHPARAPTLPQACALCHKK